jgi:type I restriction enzyme S subunit
MSGLPEGWASCSIRDVLEDSQAGFASGKKDVPKGLPHLRMNNISIDGKLDLSLLRTVPHNLAGERHFLKKGDVLVCTTNSGKLVGKCALFELDGLFAFSNHLTRLRVDHSVIDSKFLLHSFWLMWRNGEIEHKCKHWVNQSTLPKEELLDLEIVRPPLNEQRRIVAKLEKLLSRVDTAKDRLAKIPLILKRFRQSVLAAAYSGRLSERWRIRNDRSDTWKEERLGNLIIEKPRNGYSGKPVDYETSIRVLTLTATTSGVFKPDCFKFLDEAIPEKSYLWLQPGDILVQRGNTIEYVGVAAIYDGFPSQFIYPDLMMKFRAKPGVSTKYLYYALSCEQSRNYLRANAMGTAGSMPKINQGVLTNTPILIPDIDEQNEIVRSVDALFRTAKALESRYIIATNYVDDLSQSILARAFRGELVDQDPADESATAVLQKIPSRSSSRKRTSN